MINPVSNPKVLQGKKDPKRIKAKVVKSKERRRNKKEERESRLPHNQIPPILQSLQTPSAKHLIPLLRMVFFALAGLQNDGKLEYTGLEDKTLEGGNRPR